MTVDVPSTGVAVASVVLTSASAQGVAGGRARVRAESRKSGCVDHARAEQGQGDAKGAREAPGAR